MIVDYYIVRRGYLDIKALYSARKEDPYYYTYGFSWRAYTSYICGILMNIVGFVGQVGPEVPVGAQYIYNINYFSGFIVSGGMYWILCIVFPIPATSDTWNEVDIDEIEDFAVAYGQEVTDEEHVPGYEDRRSLSDSLPGDRKGPDAGSRKV